MNDEGNAVLAARFADIMNSLSETHVVAHETLAVSERVIGRYTYTARHTGPFMGYPATGRIVTMRSIDIWRVEDGKFVEHWDEVNSGELFAQLDGTARALARLGS